MDELKSPVYDTTKDILLGFASVESGSFVNILFPHRAIPFYNVNMFHKKAWVEYNIHIQHSIHVETCGWNM